MERISSNGTDFLSPAATISGQFQRVIPRGIHLTSQQLTWLFGFEKWNWIWRWEFEPVSPFDIDHTLPWVGRGPISSWSVWLCLDHTDWPPDETTRRSQLTWGTEFSKNVSVDFSPEPDKSSWLLLSIKVCKRPDLSRWPETIDYETPSSILSCRSFREVLLRHVVSCYRCNRQQVG